MSDARLGDARLSDARLSDAFTKRGDDATTALSRTIEQAKAETDATLATVRRRFCRALASASARVAAIEAELDLLGGEPAGAGELGEGGAEGAL